MATTTKLTLDEFLARPETKPYSEYACGDVYQKPMPDADHSSAQEILWLLLRQFLAGSSIGHVHIEWRCVFGPPGIERAFVPDIAFASHERLAVRGRNQRKFVWTAPDLAVEVLSPDQPAGEFADKLQFYLLHGVRLVWVIDPVERTIRFYRPGEDARLLHMGDTLDGSDVLPRFSVSVDDIFAEIED
ncbi:MAG: Uma2 family endonuclease [Dehalococcoidia bacterium]